MPSSIEKEMAKMATGIYDAMAKSHPSLERGMVRCKKCDRTLKVDSARCLREGWPKCCGSTMSLES